MFGRNTLPPSSGLNPVKHHLHYYLVPWCSSVLSKKGIRCSKNLSLTATFQSKLHTAWNSAAEKKNVNISLLVLPRRIKIQAGLEDVRLDLSGSAWGLVAGRCEHRNEPLGSHIRRGTS
jgi:hypothetical protein